MPVSDVTRGRLLGNGHRVSPRTTRTGESVTGGARSTAVRARGRTGATATGASQPMSDDFDDAHHAIVLVVEDVAVVDGAAGVGLERDPDDGAATSLDIDHVLPGRWLDRGIGDGHDLHPVSD